MPHHGKRVCERICERFLCRSLLSLFGLALRCRSAAVCTGERDGHCDKQTKHGPLREEDQLSESHNIDHEHLLYPLVLG